ncbi:hypothetical protein D3C85_1852960 [compost metagenome]
MLCLSRDAALGLADGQQGGRNSGKGGFLYLDELRAFRVIFAVLVIALQQTYGIVH